MNLYIKILVVIFFFPWQSLADEKTEKTTIDKLEKRLTDIEEKGKRQEKIIEEQKEKLESLTDEFEGSEFEGVGTFEPSFKMYGFFDIGLTKIFIKEDSMIALQMPKSLTFAAYDFNLYLVSHMTETLKFLAEVKFSYLPHGVREQTLEYRDETIIDPHTTEKTQVGGVIIERMQMNWQPADWFGIVAGRFITPFGIWNQDHGSPVILGTYAPYIMLTELVPLKQTGLMVKGRFFPSENLFLDYAITVSNGRGGLDQIYDMDDDKAFGLRLKTTYQNDLLKIALGGYGYYGKSTDEKIDVLSISPFRYSIEPTEQFKEITFSFDFLLELKGVKIQSEYARTHITHNTHGARKLPMVNMELDGVYQPNYIGWVAYVMLAWTMPLDKFLGDAKLTPFILSEVSKPDDTFEDFDLIRINGGLNLKPNAYVSIKLDVNWVNFLDSAFFTEPVLLAGTQVAIAF